MKKTKKSHKKKDAKAAKKKEKDAEPTSREFPAGSFIIRMDQPYSRIADALLDHQYWSPDDPQKTPYDDTAWTFCELFNVKRFRLTDPKFLNTPIEPFTT